MLKNRFKAVLETLGKKPGKRLVDAGSYQAEVVGESISRDSWADAAGLLIIFEY